MWACHQCLHMPAVKKRRKDVGADEADEQESDVRVIKMKLGGFCKHHVLRARITSLVDEMNILLGQAYLFANLHVLRLQDAGKDVPSIDRNFYYRCLVACAFSFNTRASTLGGDFTDSIACFDAHRPDGQAKVNITGLSQLVADMSITMATMAKNHLIENLRHRVRVYLRWRYTRVKRRLDAVVGALLDPRKKGEDLIGGEDAKSQEARDVVVAMRALLPAKITSSGTTLLPLYTHILRETEAAQAARSACARDGGSPPRLKTFTLLPTKHAFTYSHVAISNMSLMCLLKSTRLAQFAGDGRHAPHHELWAQFFNLNAVETRASRFDTRIVTDGYAVSIQMHHVRDCTQECGCMHGSDKCAGKLDDATCAVLMQDPRVRVVGVDPGITTTASGVTREGEHFEYSSARYYHEGMVKYSNRTTQRWNKQTEGLNGSLVSPRTACLGTLQDHACEYLRIQREMQSQRAKYRKLRFLRYVRKQRVVKDISEMIAPRGQFSLVFFGDWRMQSSCPISRKVGGPVREVRRALRARSDVEVRDTDEFRTSRNCSNCHECLTQMKAREEFMERGVVKTRVSRVHKVLHCKSSESGTSACLGTTWNRDANAARNILMLGMRAVQGLPRPLAFTRSSVGRGRKQPVAQRRLPAFLAGETLSTFSSLCPGHLPTAPVSQAR